MTEERMREIARGNIERNLDVDVDGYENEEAIADAIYDEAYVLASDALRDAGVPAEEANRIAQQVAMEFAQP